MESLSNKLSELFDLYKSGALSKDEYDLLKSKSINQRGEQPLKEKEQEKEPEKVVIEDVVSPPPEDLNSKQLEENTSVVEPNVKSKKKFSGKAIIAIVIFSLIIVSIILVKILIPESIVNEKNDLSAMGLKGKVKSLREKLSVKKVDFYQFDEKGRTILHNQYSPDGNLVMKITRSFDEMGHLIKHIGANGDGSIGLILTYSYDDQGKKISYLRQIPSGEGNGSYIYDSKGNLIEENESHNGKIFNKITYKYDDKGVMIESNNPFKASSIKYDSKGNIIETNDYTNKRIYRYDNHGNKLEEIYYSEGSLASKITYKYDKRKNMIEEIMDGDGDKYLSKKIYNYIYDKNGNWVKKTYLSQNEILGVDERTIEYY